MKLLRVVTEDKGMVEVRADRLLAVPSPGAPLTDPHRIYAMSLIGPEQSIRAISAGCSLVHSRTTLSFAGAEHKMTATWQSEWNAEIHAFGSGLLHLVAMHPPGDRILVMGEDADDLRIQLYHTIFEAFTTPLVPLNAPGQPEDEAKLGRKWCEVVCSAILGERRYWTRCTRHPGQIDPAWTHAGVLRITQPELDTLVGGLVNKGRLTLGESHGDGTAGGRRAGVGSVGRLVHA